MYDVITMGSAVLDALIETDKANIVSVSSVNAKKEFMAYPYGAKVEIDNFEFETGGGGVNAAVNFAKLGFKTAALVKIGDEIQSGEITNQLETAGVSLDYVIKSKEYQTGFSIILTSFQGDRTVLAHRGANAHLTIDDIDFNSLKNTKWLYLAPLNGESTMVLDKIAQFADDNGINLAVNPGTSSIKQGKDRLYSILKTAKIVVLNKDEASMLTGIDVRPDSANERFSQEIIHPDIIKMLKEIKAEKMLSAVITDGKYGTYAYDGEKFYHCGIFPAQTISTLGAGDAFAAAFTASMEKTSGDIELSLKYASINAASVTSYYGAQTGLLSFEEIKKRLKEHPDFNVTAVLLKQPAL